MKQTFNSIVTTVFVLGFVFFMWNTKQNLAFPDSYYQPYFDSVLMLKKLPARQYFYKPLNESFTEINASNVVVDCGASVNFKPLGYSTDNLFEYTHVYSKNCVYRIDSTVYRFAEVAFPNPCLANGKLAADVEIRNTTSQTKDFYLRLFYQNTTYWFATDKSMNMDTDKADYLDNFYGASVVQKVTLSAGEKQTVKIPYRIGLDPKGEFDDDANVPARPGNYEFCLLVQDNPSHPLLSDSLDLKTTNPFASIQKDEAANLKKNIAYTSPRHFRFVFLDERFDGTNDTALGHIYVPFHDDQKPLCDTCTGWYKDIISEDWEHDDFFNGKIAKAAMVKAEYGQRKRNASVSSKGIRLVIPGSTKQNKQKTWGEFFFGQAFKYGHLTVRAKLPRMVGRAGCPNGIIHNIWLYQRDYERVDTTHPYSYLIDPTHGLQKYEIDFEIWNSTREWQAWDNKSNVNFAVVDYMRNADARLKPDMELWTDKYLVDRFPKVSANIIGEELLPDWFDRFHTYEILWEPNRVRMYVDGKETADFTPDLISVPNKHLFLWIGSPLYQDGTMYTQSFIPFLESDKEAIIDYIKIE